MTWRLTGATSADVVVKLLPPTVLNFDDPSAITIYQGIRIAGPHKLTWNGTLAGGEGSRQAAPSTGYCFNTSQFR